jgi:hypothetical protein
MGKRLTPMRAIREKCLDCMGGSYREVRLCPITDCSLHVYRLGRNPQRSKRKSEKASEMPLVGKKAVAERAVSESF